MQAGFRGLHSGVWLAQAGYLSGRGWWVSIHCPEILTRRGAGG